MPAPFPNLCGLITPLFGSLQNSNSIFGLNVTDGVWQLRNRLNDLWVAFCSGVVENIIQINSMSEESANAFLKWLLKQVIPCSIVVKIEIELSFFRICTIDIRFHVRHLLFNVPSPLINTFPASISFCQTCAFLRLDCHV